MGAEICFIAEDVGFQKIAEAVVDTAVQIPGIGEEGVEKVGADHLRNTIAFALNAVPAPTVEAFTHVRNGQ